MEGRHSETKAHSLLINTCVENKTKRMRGRETQPPRGSGYPWERESPSKMKELLIYLSCCIIHSKCGSVFLIY